MAQNFEHKMRGMTVALLPRMKTIATALLALGMQKALAQDHLSISPATQDVTVEAGSTDFTVTTNIPESELTVTVDTWMEAIANAPWSGRSNHTSVVFDNKMWVIGGWSGRISRDKNDVWHSTDGVTWTMATANAAWSRRSVHTSVVFDNKMWVIGGNDGSNKNDVWHSTDGITWTRATAHAPWSARASHTSVVYDNKMWVIGGYDGSDELNDVWHSTDGITWTRATANAGWSACYSHASVVYDNKMWVIGGWTGNSRLDDVWHSTDGATWTQATANAAWSGRNGHASVVFDNKMWVIGGFDDVLQDGVWHSTDGAAWTQATADASWSSRQDHTSVVFDNKMWVIGGYDGSNNVDDVFFSEEWLTASLSGTTLTADYEANGATGTRTGTITISGRGRTATATVIQDGTGPTVTINQASSQPDPTNRASVVFDVIFSEPVTGFEASDVSYTESTVPGTLTGTVTGSGTDYTLTVIGMTGDGTVTASIPADVATDAVDDGNVQSRSVDNTVEYDITAPTVTIEQASGQPDLTNEDEVAYDIVFSEPVTGFEASDVSYTASTVSGTLIGTVTGSGTDYTLTVTGMTGTGVVAASIPAGMATDAAGNGNETSTSTDNTVEYDGTNPTVTIDQASGQPDLTHAGPVAYDIVFSEPVTGFDDSDVDLAASTVAGTLLGTVTGSGTDYTLVITGMSGTGEVTASIPANAAMDAAGNGNETSTSTDNTVEYDGTNPTVTIDQASGQEDPTNLASVVFDVTFSEPVTGFDASDVDLAASTVAGTLTGTVTGSGTDYTLMVTGMTGTGVVVASIPANAATDEAGNDNETSTSTDNSVDYDGTPPTVTVDQASGQPDLTHAGPVAYNIVFSEPVTGFEASDVSYTASTVSGTLTGTITGSGTNYALMVTGMTGTGEVVASIPANAATDAAGNGNETSTSTDNSVDYDDTPPTVTIDQASGQEDLTNVAWVVFDVVFSEPVTGFEASDVDLAASTVPGTLSGTVADPIDGTTYTLTVIGMSGTGEVTASIPTNAATDAAGNGNETSTSTDNSVDYDDTPPTVTIDQASGQPDLTHAGPVAYDIVFSEPVTDFDASDVDLAASTVAGTLSGTVTGSGTDYTLTVTGMSGTGEVVASIPTNAATDAAGNGNETSTSTDNSVDYDDTPPTVTIDQASGQPDLTHAGPVAYDIVFSEPVTGFEASDVSYTASTVSGTLTGTITGSGTDYTLMITGMSGTGVIVASIPANAATDAAGNGNEASISTDNSVDYDDTPPTVTVDQASGQPDLTHAGPVAYDIVFSEPVTDFDASDVSYTASTVSGTLTGTITGSGTDYALMVTGMTGTGVVVASIPANAATDAAGNGNEASISTDNIVAYDSTAPTVTIDQASGQDDPTNRDQVVFDVVFSEPVTGFDASDVDFATSTVAGTLSGTVADPIDGTTYTLTVTGVSGDGVVTASIPAGTATDAAGNGNEASTSTDNIVAYDNTAPTVTIDQASGQDDPTNRDQVVFDVVFSEPVTGFDASDVDLAASTVAGTLSGTVTGSGTDYTLTVTGMSGTGVVAASIPAGMATDAAGNGNVQSSHTDNTVEYGGTNPTVTIDQASGQEDPTHVASVVFDVVFSEPVTGFDASDVYLASSTVAGTLSGTVAEAAPTDGMAYTLTVTGMTGDGAVTASIPASAAKDAAGNGNVASTSTDNTVTYEEAGGTKGSGSTHLTIYPNPGSAQVTVDLGELARVEWMLFDPSGKRVRSGAIARGETTLVINTQGLLSGMYLFQVRGAEHNAYLSRRVIIRH